MSDSTFNCPHCGQSLEAPDDIQGQQINCPSCNGALIVPGTQPISAQKLTRLCPYCGEEILMTARKCKHCQEFLDPTLRRQAQIQQAPQPVYLMKPAVSRVVYVLLGFFLGGLFGLHNFYARRYIQAIIQLIIILLTGWFFVGIIINALWVFGEVFDVTTDGDGRPMKEIAEGKNVANWCALIFIALPLALLVIFFVTAALV